MPGGFEHEQGNSGSFRTTHWSVVLAAGQREPARKQEALGALYRAYAHPIYGYVRRRGHDAHKAQDLMQDFFMHLLEKDVFTGLTREGGKFRSFLLTVLKRFLASDWTRSQAQKRGGGCELVSLDAEIAENRYRIEPADPASPDAAFERSWANTLLERVMNRLETEYKQWRKAELFEHLRVFLCSKKDAPHSELGARLGMSAGAVKTAVCRLRRRYREILREEIAETVATAEEVDEEIRYLITILGR
jgi:RNA polymerase sigma factor (sigma-70 family)